MDYFSSICQAIFTVSIFIVLKFAYDYYTLTRRSISHSPSSFNVQKKDWKKDVVYLYQFPRPSFLPNTSPFCLKIEAFLRAHNIKYEVASTLLGRSMKGYLPFIELNGDQIADSQMIVFHLKKYFNIQDDLTVEQKIVERAFERMIEGSLFSGLNWLKVKYQAKAIAGGIIETQWGRPYVWLKHIIFPYFVMLFYTRFVKEGTGRHRDEEVMVICRNDLWAIENYLGDKNFFFGDNISLIDILIFAHVAAVYYVPYSHLSKEMLEAEFPKILNHVKKIENLLFPDFKFGS